MSLVHNPKTFVPVYSRRIKLSFLVTMLVCGALIVYNGFDDVLDISAILVILLFCLTIIAFPLMFIKRIIFQHNIVIERYILSPKIYQYSDVIDFGNLDIRMKNGSINLLEIANVVDLLALFEEAFSCGLITQNQIQGTLIKAEYIALSAAGPAAIISFCVTVILSFSESIREHFNSTALGVAVFLVVYLAAISFMSRKKKEKNE